MPARVDGSGTAYPGERIRNLESDAMGHTYNQMRLAEVLLADLAASHRRTAHSGRIGAHGIVVMLAVPRLRALLQLRLAQKFARSPIGNPAALWLTARLLRSCGAEIHPLATIGPGLRLAHTTGIVIGAQVVAGNRLTLHQNVTLGGRKRGDGQPTIGNNVVIATGAKILGPVHIGDGARIGANAVVLHDVPARTLVVPAGIVTSPVRKRKARVPAANRAARRLGARKSAAPTP